MQDDLIRAYLDDIKTHKPIAHELLLNISRALEDKKVAAWCEFVLAASTAEIQDVCERFKLKREELTDPAIHGDILEKVLSYWAAARTRPISKKMLRAWAQMLDMRDAVLQPNLMLAFSVAQGFNKGENLMDLVQESNCGLIKAVYRFDWRMGNKFSTYAIWWCQHAVRRWISDKSRAVRIPVHRLDQRARLHKAQNQLLAQVGRATSEELAERLKLSVAQVDLLRQLEAPLLFLDEVIDDERGSRTHSEAVMDESPSAVEQLIDRETKERMYSAMGVLTEMERVIVESRYLGGETLNQIGERLGYTKERIRQIEVKALAKVRQEMTRTE